MDHLLAKGHPAPALILGPKGRLARARFLRTVHEHCLERDVDPDVLMTEDGDYTVEGGYAAMQRLLQRRRIGHIAVFAANDLMALGAMMAARDAGKECPRDVSILGFDGIPAGAFSWPGLTTIEKPARELGYRATDNLLAEIAGRRRSPPHLPRLPADRARIPRRSLRARTPPRDRRRPPMSSIGAPSGGNVPGSPDIPKSSLNVTNPGANGSSAFLSGLHRWWPYYLMMAPGLLFFLIWHYFPIWEAKMAFEQVRIIPPNIWVGLKHFQTLFASPVFYQVLANTLIISSMKFVFVLPDPDPRRADAQRGPRRRAAQVHPVGDLPAALPELGGDRRHLHRAALALRRRGQPDARLGRLQARSTS